jgi:hypothetical protein
LFPFGKQQEILNVSFDDKSRRAVVKPELGTAGLKKRRKPLLFSVASRQWLEINEAPLAVVVKLTQEANSPDSPFYRPCESLRFARDSPGTGQGPAPDLRSIRRGFSLLGPSLQYSGDEARFVSSSNQSIFRWRCLWQLRSRYLSQMSRPRFRQDVASGA